VKHSMMTGLALCALIYSAAFAQPYTPKNDNEVLEQLPAHGESWFEIRSLRKSVESDPVRQAKLVISCKVKVLAWNLKE